MTKVQTLIEEISKLEAKDLEIIMKEILQRVNRKHKIESILDNFIGSGQGVWGLDAQEYINGLREDDRF